MNLQSDDTNWGHKVMKQSNDTNQWQTSWYIQSDDKNEYKW